MSVFVNPDSLISQLNLKGDEVVVNFGSGSGFYVAAAARKVGVSGRVIAVDVQESRLEAVRSLVRQMNLSGVSTYSADLEKPWEELQPASVDLLILTSILHHSKNRNQLIQNAYRLLKSRARLLLVEWRTQNLALGPDISVRVSEEEAVKIFAQAGFQKTQELVADGYHYALVFEK
jgi:ubiquinone/menaquinone biosynthesis C-methylase UbiE